MDKIVEGRVVIVTGAGRGIGRAEALAFARGGAKVVVNDLATPEEDPAAAVVAEIEAFGGEAIADHTDVSDWAGAERLVASAVGTYGDLHVVVNNAGILRDRMLVNMSEREWDDVIRVHLRGTFAVTRHAAAHWRTRSKAGDDVRASVINTSSASGLYGNAGQANYGAAKAGIASFSVIAAEELRRYGVRVNAIAPTALTRMTEGLRERGQEEKLAMDPARVASLVVWLGSTNSEVTGRVFNVGGGRISVAEGWVAGPEIADDGLTPAELGKLLPVLTARARGNSAMDGRTRTL
ncbi:SDR family oxidoreductase [Actinomadura sp. LOL_016]|uniref:SDR family oxidoreductase n=1 Tax=unclassified Actinomadura TaxID=2626254 RepID=UPI003A7FA5D3